MTCRDIQDESYTQGCTKNNQDSDDDFSDNANADDDDVFHGHEEQ